MIVYFNVALNGRHLFTTDKFVHSADQTEKGKRVLAEKFPKSEGYSVSQYTQDGSWDSTEVN
jgi:hypothetical protein